MEVNGGSDGKLIVAGAEDGRAHVCHIETKRVVTTLRHFEPPNTMDEDEEVELPMSVEAVGFASHDPSWCATGGVDGVLKIWDLSKDGLCRQVCRQTSAKKDDDENDNMDDASQNSNHGGITRLEWHPSLPLVFTSCTDGNILLWDARSGKLIHTLTGHTDVINDMSIRFIDNGNTAVIVSGSDDKYVRVFEVDVASLLQQAP